MKIYEIWIGVKEIWEGKLIGLNTIMKQITAKDKWGYSDDMLDLVAVFRCNHSH